MKLTKNFKLSEFQCSCGCEMPNNVLKNIKELAENLQTIRDAIDEPLHLTNAYRCKKKNKQVGGVKDSQHLLGKAADIKVKKFTPRELANAIEHYINKGYIDEGGVGRYNTFTHYDIRGTKARWNNER